TDGAGNVAIGDDALFSSDGSYNTAVGYAVGENLTLATSSENIYIGDSAGTLDFLGNPGGDEFGVIRIGSFSSGTNACFINGIANNGPFADTVTIDPAAGQLGGLPSSARFKKDIEPRDKTSEAIYSLKPVTFHYKKDKTNTPWFGLIAEDVAKVNPALIGVDKEGKPYCVAYDKVNAMLLNEFLKEHRKVQELEATVAKLTAVVEKESAQLELSKPAPQTALNNQLRFHGSSRSRFFEIARELVHVDVTKTTCRLVMPMASVVSSALAAAIVHDVRYNGTNRFSRS